MLKTVGLATGVGLAGCTSQPSGDGSDGSGSDGSSGDGSSGDGSSGDGSGGTTSGGDAQTITIGVSLPRSGSFSTIGTLVESSYVGFADWVNNDLGGIESPDGTHDVDLDIRDDQSTESRAANLATRFSTSGEHGAFIQAYGSPLVRAAASVADQNQQVMMSSVSANDPLHREFDYLFQGSRTITRFGDAALLEGEVEKVAVWGPDFSWVDLSLQTFVDAAPDHGLEVVVDERHPRDLSDFSPLILQAQENGAEALVQCGYTENTQLSIEGIASSEWRPKYAGLQGVTRQIAEEVGSPTVHKLGSPSIWDSSLDHGTNPQFDEFYAANAPEGEDATYQSALAWATMEVFKAGIEALGNDFNDSDALREWYMDASVETVIGTEEWDDQGAQTGVEWNLAQWQNQDGELVRPYVYPEEFKQADFRFPKTEW